MVDSGFVAILLPENPTSVDIDGGCEVIDGFAIASPSLSDIAGVLSIESSFSLRRLRSPFSRPILAVDESFVTGSAEGGMLDCS